MSIEFEQIAKLLLKLNVEELAEVRARAGILGQAGGSKAPTASAAPASMAAAPAAESQAESDTDLVLGEIVSHMRSEGIEYASMQQIKGMTIFRNFSTKKVPPTMIYFRKITGNRVKLRAIIRMSIRLLYKDMAKIGMNQSTRAMMNNFDRIPSVINQNFPGYAKAGMLGLLVNSGAVDLKYVSEAPIERKANVRDE